MRLRLLAEKRNPFSPSATTEAGCKTVFTQRLKRSGMSWCKDSGQVIVDLRILHLSGVWPDVLAQNLRDRVRPIEASGIRPIAQTFKKAS